MQTKLEPARTSLTKPTGRPGWGPAAGRWDRPRDGPAYGPMIFSSVEGGRGRGALEGAGRGAGGPRRGGRAAPGAPRSPRAANCAAQRCAVGGDLLRRRQQL